MRPPSLALRGLALFAALAALAGYRVTDGFSDATPATTGQEPPGDRPIVVLMHGLGRTSRSMTDLQSALTAAGYDTVNLGYPSTEKSIEALAELLHAELGRCCLENRAPVHFVTHSLGGIIVRYYLDQRELESLGRVLMISPPNQGSELIDALGDNRLFQAGLGPAAQQLGTDEESLPNQLGPVDFELGVITGDSSLNPLFSWLIPGVDDGKVSIERARVAGMSDFLVVPHSHSFIMSADAVIAQTLRFLESGEFDHSSPAEEPSAPID